MWLCLSLSIEFGNITSTVHCSVVFLQSFLLLVPVCMMMLVFISHSVTGYSVTASGISKCLSWLQKTKSKVRSQKSKMKAHDTKRWKFNWITRSAISYVFNRSTVHHTKSSHASIGSAPFIWPSTVSCATANCAFKDYLAGLKSATFVKCSSVQLGCPVPGTAFLP